MPHGRAPDGYATPAFRWLVRLVAVSATVLIPWAAYLANTHPPSVSARHWPLAWTGLDIAMAVGLGATGWLAIRRDRWLAVPAVSTATLLAADAWFDVCTAPAGRPLALALADTCVELAEAAACLALAYAIWRDVVDLGRRFGLPPARIQAITTMAGPDASPWLAGISDTHQGAVTG
jgi:hypothetical protein